MSAASSDRVTISQILVPMTVMGFVLTFFFLFQLTQVMKDRGALTVAYSNQEQAFTESGKLNAQFGGLVIGTQKLAREGNATAADMEKRLKQIGVIPNVEQAPVPAAMESKVPGPVKP